MVDVCITISVNTIKKNNTTGFKSMFICLNKQSKVIDHVQLILVAAAVQGWTDNDKTNMFGFRMCIIYSQ